MKDKVILTVVGIILTCFYFLIGSYFDGFVTKAAYNEDKAVIVGMAKDIKHIREKVDKLTK